MKINDGVEKFKIIKCLVVLIFLLLITRLWQLQIIHGNEYSKISEANRLRIINIAAPRGIIFDRNGVPLVKNSVYFCASLIPQEFNKEKVSSLSQILNVPTDEILDKINKKDISPFIPIKLKEGLTLSEIAFIEARRSDFPGLIIETEISREYIYGEVGSHLIGYLGKISPLQSKDPAFKDLHPDTFIGQCGIEKLFDKVLRGAPGKKIIEVNALGKEIRLLQEKPPIKGQDITLSIDINLMREADKAFGGNSGALVAIKPQTGEVLALISKPSFDPNLFSRGISRDAWLSLKQDRDNPLLNRALQSQYPPGSTFKIVTALAGLEEGIITSDTKVNCKGGISYGRWHFGCWRKNGHNILSLKRAIIESCDVYFYEVGKRLGIDKLYNYALNLGLGKKTGIELGSEKSGLIPNTQWKLKEYKKPWFPGETFIASIGQGYISVTPIQLAVMLSSIVNGGNLFKPILIKDGIPQPTGKINIKPENLEFIKEALYGVVNDNGGTGWAARSPSVNIGGKTGTAQVVGIRRSSEQLSKKFRDHAWFIAFAPVEKPEIALSVLVEHGGHGGVAAAPIARKAIEAYSGNSKQNL